ncbi:MAG: hypothetical protein KME11_05325 [Timaviella obliquedivisa GSE-PSE-MK23-08B]|jgi:hypothetical protein|nr:hypothetical protein [Timaviella obliquedivisa GSE-PSE-MK23-08B]
MNGLVNGLAILDGFHSLHGWHGLAQTPDGAATSQVEFLRQQLEFLARENARQGAEFTEKLKLLADENQKLSESFKTFVSAMKDGVYFVGILSALGIGILTFLFGKSLKEAKDTAKAAVTRQVEERMAAIADHRIDVVRRSLERESVVDRAQVAYWLLDAQMQPRELALLETRGFQVQFCTQPQRGRDIDVVVVDLNNWQDGQGRIFAESSPMEKEQQVRRQVDLVKAMMVQAAIVVFVSGRFDYLDQVGRDRLVAPTNNSVTLVGMVVDAAYLMVGDR